MRAPVLATFLVRDFSNRQGFRAWTPPSGALPRTRQESYVPWALHVGRVVYAKTGEHNSWRGGEGVLRRYDAQISQQRRRLAESELGMHALKSPRFSAGAVGAVSRGVKRYLVGLLMTDADKVRRTVFDSIGAYFYTAGGTGFGRISEADKNTVGVVNVWTGIIDTLDHGRLDQQLAIHDAVGRKLLPVFGGTMKGVYESWGPKLRQKWFDDEARRGRAKVSGAKPTTTGGTAPVGSGMSATAQSRTRGVDMFGRDATRMRDVGGDAYYDDVDARNLLFGAGISGTTGTLLQAALAFGKLDSVDALKQYVFGIIGYLVGGGMHSYHESMAVAQKVGIPYDPGAFERSLPLAFTISSEFARWREAYYDIVVLGATHWRNNDGALPSHLNANLRPDAPPAPRPPRV